MTPLEFIFTLLEKYVPVSPGRFQALQKEATLWYESEEPETHRVGRWVKERGDKWYWQLALAGSYIFFARMIHDFMNPKDEEPERGRI